MDHPGVTRQLSITADLARRFGFVGTPALVIGRTATLGALSDSRLERLIEIERQEPHASLRLTGLHLAQNTPGESPLAATGGSAPMMTPQVAPHPPKSRSDLSAQRLPSGS